MAFIDNQCDKCHDYKPNSVDEVQLGRHLDLHEIDAGLAYCRVIAGSDVYKQTSNGLRLPPCMQFIGNVIICVSKGSFLCFK